jgi:tRNA G46 methylase TrmB
VDLIELPREMTKGEIAAHMVEVGFGKGNAAVEAAIKYVAKKNPVGKTVKKATAVEAEATVAE